MGFDLTWLDLQTGDVDEERLALWKCEVGGPEGM